MVRYNGELKCSPQIRRGGIIMTNLTNGPELDPKQVKKLACKSEIESICNKYGLVAMPVVTIVGNQMSTAIQLFEISAQDDVPPAGIPVEQADE